MCALFFWNTLYIDYENNRSHKCFILSKKVRHEVEEEERQLAESVVRQREEYEKKLDQVFKIYEFMSNFKKLFRYGMK